MFPCDISCSAPNASVSFRGKRIVVRTLAPVSSASDLALASAVTISYIDRMEHTKVRKRELLRRRVCRL